MATYFFVTRGYIVLELRQISTSIAAYKKGKWPNTRHKTILGAYRYQNMNMQCARTPNRPYDIIHFINHEKSKMTIVI